MRTENINLKKIVMYAHGGSGNHGCEAIVRSTLKILEDIKTKKILISTRPEEDKKYKIDSLCSVDREQTSYSKKSKNFLSAYLKLKICNDYIPMEKLQYREAVSKVGKGDIALSIGGDNYCYADYQRYIMLHDMYLNRGAKTILWGCSIEPELLKRKDVINDLKKYHLITARETITYNAVKEINPNTVLVSDPAFLLDKKTKDNIENKRWVGINISPMVVDNEAVNGITMKNYENLINYILETTNLNIMLIPHVVWEFSNDFVPLKNLNDKYKKLGRIKLLEDMSCEDIKGYIAKCRYFIGARTHSTIAAYSNCIPTLVIGYSVKAIGIARDLFGTDENYVIPVQKIKKDNELVNQFKWLCNHEKQIVKILEDEMENYKERAYIARNAIEQLL